MPDQVIINALNSCIINGARARRDKFMAEYDRLHAACPKCGALAYGSTYMGFIFNANDPNSYKDENHATCGGCGDKHLVHDRVMINEE